MNTDVVIAGGGPVGLLLAAELRLGGVSVTVLERLTEQSQALKAGGINGRATQFLTRRGLGARLAAEAEKHDEGFAAFARKGGFGGHFGRLFLKAGPDLDVPPSTALPQQALERLLSAWAAELGADVRRGHEVTDFVQDPDGVTVRAATADGETRIRAGYLVGCDGGRSTVRKLAGFDFPGTDPITTGYQAIVTLADPDALPTGWHLTDVGLYGHGAMPGRIITVAFDGPPADRDAEITAAELQAELRRVSGTDAEITSVQAATRFTDNTRQASTYRKGRVLLAGDSAHVHPPFGGQGLNLGMADAANLGWKLAGTVRGWAPPGLLDGYTAERHPEGARVLANTRAQIAIMRPDPYSRAMRELLGGLLESTDLNDRLLSEMQGLDVRYDMGTGTHPLTGRHMPDLPGTEAALAPGRPVLFDLAGSVKLRAVAERWSDRVDVCAPPRTTGPAALLVRPDGYVAWATDDEPDAADPDALEAALRRWFGEPGGQGL